MILGHSSLNDQKKTLQWLLKASFPTWKTTKQDYSVEPHKKRANAAYKSSI